MIKIAFKEPVTSGFMKETNEYFERGWNWIRVQGNIDEALIARIGRAMPTDWLSFTEPGGNTVLIPLNNVAYFQEQSDGANN